MDNKIIKRLKNYLLFGICIYMSFFFGNSGYTVEENHKNNPPYEWFTQTPLGYMLRGKNGDDFPVRTKSIIGYLSIEDDVIRLYFNKYDYCYCNYENSVVLAKEDNIELINNEQIQKWNGYPVELFIQNDGIQESFVADNATLDAIAIIHGTINMDTYLTSSNPSDHIYYNYQGENKDRYISPLVKESDGSPATMAWAEWRHGNGDKVEEAMAVSIYRYMWNPEAYIGKWVEMTGRLRLFDNGGMPYFSFVYPHGNPILIDNFIVAQDYQFNGNEKPLDGSLIMGYGKIEIDGTEIWKPIVDYSYMKSMVILRTQMNDPIGDSMKTPHISFVKPTISRVVEVAQ
ncbi:hypothetical protein LJC20_05020 [Eubacteriales bacterium OttesenSCG-928-M02]|nr:hypothetical protein [Eubacteriales bacterium OttesenSCG-928-M02]